MDEKSLAEFQDVGEVDFAHALPGGERFRINLFRDQGGVGAVLRVIPSKILSFEQLGLPEAVRSLCEHPKGMVLVTGPTGSGKSTTMAAMIDHINQTRKTHIITLEDPIEFVHKSSMSLVNQREIGSHTQSFSRALKSALREDPDIVLVGEMRDLETISLALEIANTGHLVFGTLHTTTAIGTIERIVEIFPSEEQNRVRNGLADTLRGVVAQILCKKTGGGAGRVVRGPPVQPGGSQSHSGKQGPPDHEPHADGESSGQQSAQRGARPPGVRGCRGSRRSPFQIP